MASQRFGRLRRALPNKPKGRYRPEYHFTPPLGWMNDPNGLVFYEGEYHLFYQHIPPGLEGLHWGHAVSSDLMNWTHLPVALAPDEHGDIWSGSVVVDHNDSSGLFAGRAGLVAIFTHHLPASQSQSLAYSDDRGRTWVKFDGNPVLMETLPDFRDPKVFWHSRTDCWCMIAAAGAEARIYTSPNLKEWTYRSAFAAPQPDGVWECPDLIELSGRWVLNASFVAPDIWDSHSFYWVGAFDGVAFIPETEPCRLSFGPDDYAAVTWNDAPDDRKLLMGWMSRWAYAWKVPTQDEGFQGVLTLPRKLSLTGDTLWQNVLPEMERHRGSAVYFDETPFSFSGEAYELEAEIDFTGLQEQEVGFQVRVGEHEATEVVYKPVRQELGIRRARSGCKVFHPDFAGEFWERLAIPDGLLKLRIFVDRCSVEVFAQDGLMYSAALIFPSSNARGIRFFGQGSRIKRGVIYDYAK